MFVSSLVHRFTRSPHPHDGRQAGRQATRLLPSFLPSFLPSLATRLLACFVVGGGGVVLVVLVCSWCVVVFVGDGDCVVVGRCCAVVCFVASWLLFVVALLLLTRAVVVCSRDCRCCRYCRCSCCLLRCWCCFDVATTAALVFGRRGCASHLFFDNSTKRFALLFWFFFVLCVSGKVSSSFRARLKTLLSLLFSSRQRAPHKQALPSSAQQHEALARRHHGCVCRSRLCRNLR